MARPIQLFQGPAPEAMSHMGEGLAAAGARIGEFKRQGLTALGEGIGQGIVGLAQGIKANKDAAATNKVFETMLSSPEMSNTFFGIPQGAEGDDQRKFLMDNFRKTIKEYGQVGGSEFSSKFLSPLAAYHQLGVKHARDLEMQAQSPQWGSVAAQFQALQNKSVAAPDVKVGSVEEQTLRRQ